MNKRSLTKTIFCFVVLTITILGTLELSQAAQSSSNRDSTDVGRENPFAEILSKQNFNLRSASQPTQVGQEPPKLFAQAITLQYLDAESAAEAFECMSSGFGKVNLIEKSNTLLIMDTKENLERILSELRKIDKPVPGLAVEAVTFKFLDAKSAKDALIKMCSEDGNITIAEKSNSLIICDTKRNVETIRTEITKIDKPIPGLVVEVVTLKNMDAKSAKAALETTMTSEYGSISIIERTNSLVVCDIRKNLDMILAEVQKIDKPTSGLVVETVNLKFLDAKNFKTVLDKMVSQYGSVATNEKTNSVIICDTWENLARILEEIKRADKTPQQIMVEVVILDVQLKDDTEIGVNWDEDIPFSVTYKQDFGTGTATDMSLVTLTGSITDIIHVIQQKRKAEILASPRAMMVSGQTAKIKAVEEIPFMEVSQTEQGGSLTSTQFKDVGVTLEVTAILTTSDNIFLTVAAEQSVKTSVSLGGVPVVDSRNANTSLLLKDGQIVVMGGLRRQEKTKQVDRIPLLGDFPIIGGLFENINTVINNSELIVLISPHIYKGEPVPHEAIVKYNKAKDDSPLKRIDDQSDAED